MIKGHGDDAYLYGHITTDFSSNVYQSDVHAPLMAHLAARPELIAHYPEPEAWSLERLIASQCGVDPCAVIVTGGATEAIYLTAQAFRMRHRCQQPTFSEYADAIRMFRSEHPCGRARWLCNPNNPTGRACTGEEVLQMARREDLLVVDQSYEHYTAVAMLSPQEAVAAGNIVQIHSLTKTYAVPGLRLGYIVAAPPLARRLRSCLRPWSVGALAVEGGRFLMNTQQPVRVDLAEARRLRRRLMELPGVVVEETDTNFMLCQLSGATAACLKDYLARTHGMLIRDASNFCGLTDRHFRVAARTPDEDDALVDAIRFFLETKSAER